MSLLLLISHLITAVWESPEKPVSASRISLNFSKASASSLSKFTLMRFCALVGVVLVTSVHLWGVKWCRPSHIIVTFHDVGVRLSKGVISL